MRPLFLAIVALATACTLDPSTKPQCNVTDDCWNGMHCVAQQCVEDQTPVAVDDVFYVYAGATYATGDVVANDSDPDGDPLSISTYAQYATVLDDHTIQLRLYTSSFNYYVSDGHDWDEGMIQVVTVPQSATIPMMPNSTADLYNVLGNAILPGDLELVTPPAHGALTDSLYTPNMDFCGQDSVAFVAHGDNADVPITVSFDVNITLADDAVTVPFGSSSSIDVLANDGTGLEITGVNNTALASISGDKQRLVVTPPTGVPGTYNVTYTARDARGCEASATLTITTRYPTRVLVGEGHAGDSFDPAMSGDGRYVAFTSSDSTLVSGDTNDATDVFVLDIETGAIERISVATDGTQGNGASTSPSISLDGRYVAFASAATNFAAADTTVVDDIYVHDRTTGVTTFVSVSVDNTGSDQPSQTPHISADGTHVAFTSSATRLIVADTNGVADVFVRDLVNGGTKRATVTSSGGESPFASLPRPRISGDGRYVVLATMGSLDAPASSNAGTFLVDTTTMGVTRISNTTATTDIDSSGRYVLYGAVGDYHWVQDRVIDTAMQTAPAVHGSLAPNGKCVAVVSYYDRINASCGGTDQSVIVSPDGGFIEATVLRRPALSADGRWITFATSEWPGEMGHYVIVRVWNKAYVP